MYAILTYVYEEVTHLFIFQLSGAFFIIQLSKAFFIFVITWGIFKLTVFFVSLKSNIWYNYLFIEIGHYMNLHSSQRQIDARNQWQSEYQN